jgi:hypothetical protein
MSSASSKLVWIPVVLIAALLYWTVALGLGGLSLIAVSRLSGDEVDDVAAAAAEPAESTEPAPPRPEPTATEPVPGTDSTEPIVVHLQESVDPQDVNDNAGSGL